MYKLLTGCLGIMAHNRPMPRAQPEAEVDYESLGNQSTTHIFTEGTIQTWILIGCFEKLPEGQN